MELTDKVKDVFVKVLKVKPEEVDVNAQLYANLGCDSTEMVEISVALEKTFGVDLADNEVKKTHSISEITEILKAKGAK
ncbi:MAG: acyl carrier protein [Candidatus Omnitrophota bacterium]